MVKITGYLAGAVLVGSLFPLASGARAAAAADDGAAFAGTFGDVASSGAKCDGIFSTSAYQLQFALTGPTERIAVLQLTAAGGFFDKIAFEGLLGGDDDLDFDKTVVAGGISYAVNAQGNVGPSVIYLDFTVVATGPDGKEACTASATLSGFNQE